MTLDWPKGPMIEQSERAYAAVLARAAKRQRELELRDAATWRRARALRFKAQRYWNFQRWEAR